MITWALLVSSSVLLTHACSNQKTAQETPTAPAPPPSAPAPTESKVPRFHFSAEAAQPFPRILPAEMFRDFPAVAQAYRIAAKMPGTIAQQPCYCWCDRFGHGSLLDCFATDHGAACDICVKEVLLAERMTQEGANAKQIREAIIQEAWKSVDLEAVSK